MKIVVIADTGSRGGYTQMRHARIFLSVITLSSLLGLTPAGLAQSLNFTWTSIDPVGASSTFANGIRSAGSTTSVPYSAQGAANGVRNQFGEEQHQDSTTFPGQGNALGQNKHQGTGSTTSTGSTQVVGYFWDTVSTPHSYLLTYLSTGATWSAINATGAYGTWTFATGVNSTGQITGYYYAYDPVAFTFRAHGFVQTGGSTSSFDVPGAVDTFGNGISSGGQVAGSYSDAKGTHAFVRGATGTSYTTFDAPGAVNGTVAAGVNDTGMIVGYYYDAVLCPHGFLRSLSGSTYTQIDITGATCTSANAINGSGQIAGHFFNSTGVHGFLRSAAGSIATIDYPLSSGTIINALNDSGQIAGEYMDSTNRFHGYKTGP
ncbi:MAG TPA: hypothetical protein VFW01_05125 [bacterium]|nr:hypothetical protein [bacterium]